MPCQFENNFIDWAVGILLTSFRLVNALVTFFVASAKAENVVGEAGKRTSPKERLSLRRRRRVVAGKR